MSNSNMTNEAAVEKLDEANDMNLIRKGAGNINYLFKDILSYISIKRTFFLFILYMAITSTYFDEYFIFIKKNINNLLEQNIDNKDVDVLLIKSIVFIIIFIILEMLSGIGII